MITEKIIVFLDTCIFVSENFFQGNNLKQIYKHSNDGLCELKITDIVKREVLKQIGTSTKESFVKLRETKNILRKGARILNNNSEYNSFITSIKNLNEEHIIVELKERFIQDLIKNKIEVIETSYCACGKIFDDYFSAKPPFGKADKKSEFPDAFNIEVIRQWADKNTKKVFFITKDKDYQDLSISGIDFSYSELSSLSEHILKLNNEIHIKFIHDKFNNEKNNFKNYILKHIDLEKITSIFYDYLYSKLFIQEIDIEEPTDIGISIEHMFVTFLDLNYSCILDIKSDIWFDIYASYNDYDSGFYDKEDGIWYGVESTTEKFSILANAVFQIDCDYNLAKDIITPMKIEDFDILDIKESF